MTLTVMCMVVWADIIVCWIIKYYPFIILGFMLILTILLNIVWNPPD